MGRAWENPGLQIAPNASATGQEVPQGVRWWELTLTCLVHARPLFGLPARASLRGPKILLGEETVFVESLLGVG